MATKKQWLPFADAIDLAEEIVLELTPKVPLERFVEECLKEHRPDLVGFDLGSRLPVALLSAACASGKVRTRHYYARGKQVPIATESWHDVGLDFWWMGLTEDDQLNVPDLRQWFSDQFLRPRRRGRKPKVDWNGSVKRRLFELLDYHGPPDISDPKWSTQADVESAVADIVEDICGVSLSESTVREHTARLISEWWRKKAGN
jgi:hypothetical protein